MTNPLLDNSQRARTILIIFWILATLQVVSVISAAMQLQLLYRFNEGNIDADAAATNDLRQKIIAFTYVGTVIVSIVFFIMWFRRAYANLERIGRVILKYAEGWSAGAWFVPFLNLVRPYEIMKEIWHKTQEATTGLVQYKQGALVGWWWTIWLITNIISNISFRFASRAATIDQLISSTIFDIVDSGLEIISILVTIYMIHQASLLEAKLNHSYSLPVEEGEDKLADIII